MHFFLSFTVLILTPQIVKILVVVELLELCEAVAAQRGCRLRGRA